MVNAPQNDTQQKKRKPEHPPCSGGLYAKAGGPSDLRRILQVYTIQIPKREAP